MTPAAPTPTAVKQYNQLSFLLERVLKQEADGRLLAVLRESIHVIVDIVQTKLDILKGFMQQPIAARNYASAAEMMTAKLAMIRNDYIQGFNVLLGTRDAYMDNGRIVNLTPEIKDQLRASFAVTLDQTIRQCEPELRLDANTDLEVLQQQNEENLSLSIDIVKQFRESRQKERII